jgi:phage tail sheath gpL-like
MGIPFRNIPSNLRVPLFYAEVNNSQANTSGVNQRGLIVGQMLAAGTATAGVPVLSQGPLADLPAFGQGSMVARMIDAWRQNDNFGELWVLPLADDGSGVSATGTVVFTGPSTATGVLSLYIAGILTSTVVTSGMTATQIATAVAASIAANPNLPVTSSPSTGTLTLTARNKGPLGNDIDIRLNYQGTAGGEATPAGVGTTITAMASGATAPSLTTPFANCSDMPFDFIAFPYTDTTSLNAMQAFLNDTVGRWSWDRQVYGSAFGAYRGTLSAVTTFGLARNDQHMSITGFNDSPSQNAIWAAAIAAQAAISVRADPAQPIRSVTLQGVLAPPVASRFQLSDRNTLLWSGISTFDVQTDGSVMIEKLITTYQTNAQGVADNSYLDVEILTDLAFVLRTLKTRITSKFGRMKLAADGTKFAVGSNIVTPSIVKADQIAAYRELEFNGLVQDTDAFKEGLIVSQNSQNPNRLDVLWDGILIDRLDIFALLAQFRNSVPPSLPN